MSLFKFLFSEKHSNKSLSNEFIFYMFNFKILKKKTITAQNFIKTNKK